MSVAIIDYGSGNLHSAAKAFERARAQPRKSAKGFRHQRSRSGLRG
ncbi:imidazoleglycerol phosphate synthase glutamine amidotransferase subunit HisH [Bradyrhizobium ottawaense]